MEVESLSSILENTTTRSLVLIDEFGKGTHYMDGISLFNGIWMSFLKQSSKAEGSSPLLCITCGQPELFEQGIIKQNDTEESKNSKILEMISKSTSSIENPLDYKREELDQPEQKFVHLYKVADMGDPELSPKTGITASLLSSFRCFHMSQTDYEDKLRAGYAHELNCLRSLLKSPVSVRDIFDLKMGLQRRN